MNYKKLLEDLESFIIKLWAEKDSSFKTLSKNGNDLVTEVDLYFEREINSLLNKLAPNIPILSEEYNPDTDAEGTFFTVDPIDGTWNFARGVPIYGTQIALIENNKVVLGLIHLPTVSQTYKAIKDQGAFMNNEPIKVNPQEIKKSVISINDIRNNPKTIDFQLSITKDLALTFSKCRMVGCTSFDLAMVGGGHYQGKISLNPNLWDIAPGMVIVREAGGISTYNKDYSISAASEEIYQTIYTCYKSNKNRISE